MSSSAGLRPSVRSSVAPFHVMRLFEAAAARRATGAPVFDLSAGQPSAPAPAAVSDAARRALDAGRLGYTAARGLPQLRGAIAGHYLHTYGLDVDPDDVVVTTGSSGAFVLAFLAAFDAGDRVALARPGYPAYRNTLQALGCEVVEVACGAENGFRLTVDQLERLDSAARADGATQARDPHSAGSLAGLVLASPANPTGTMNSPEELVAITQWCQDNGVRLISDEIYSGITYGKPVATAWQTSHDAIVVNSFSKYFCMTGWRLGWLLAPTDLRDRIDALATNLALCPPTLSQLAAVHAFDDYTALDAHVATYRRNRELLLTGLASMGVDRCAPVDGAFYVYADVSDLGLDSMQLCTRMLAETGVASAPGVDFDPVDGARYLRLSFAAHESVISGALDALARWLPTVRA